MKLEEARQLIQPDERMVALFRLGNRLGEMEPTVPEMSCIVQDWAYGQWGDEEAAQKLLQLMKSLMGAISPDLPSMVGKDDGSDAWVSNGAP